MSEENHGSGDGLLEEVTLEEYIKLSVSQGVETELYSAFQYAYGYRQHPSMRGSSLAAAWTSYKEYKKS